MTEEAIFAGFGGQGVLSMGMMLAYSGMMYTGFHGLMRMEGILHVWMNNGIFMKMDGLITIKTQ